MSATWEPVTKDSTIDWSSWPYRIGCPVWTCKNWSDVIYPRGTPATRSLEWYSRSFNTVEGSSTFYAMPKLETFQRWADSVPGGFAFSFKVPQLITHETELNLDVCGKALDDFLERLQILAKHDCLGATLVQLGPSFSSRQRGRLERFIERLPKEFAWAVEVRHKDWFDESNCERGLDHLLEQHKIDRVLFDSTPLNSLPPDDAIEAESQRRKPRSPFRTTVTAKAPFVRLIGRNTFEQVATFWDNWSVRIANWIESGLNPAIFLHAPDDTFAPHLAWEMHRRVKAELKKLNSARSLPELPSRDTVESLINPKSASKSNLQQRMLF